MKDCRMRNLLITICAIVASAVLPSMAHSQGLPTRVVAVRQTVTASAVALPYNNLVNGIVICANPTNSANVEIGGSTVTVATGDILTPGWCRSLAVANSNLVYIIGANATDGITGSGN